VLQSQLQLASSGQDLYQFFQQMARDIKQQAAAGFFQQ